MGSWSLCVEYLEVEGKKNYVPDACERSWTMVVPLTFVSICFKTPSGGTKLMLLEGFTKHYKTAISANRG